METKVNGKKKLAEASWIWPDNRLYDLHNTYANFRKDFFLDTLPEKAILFITADQCYRLWVNGNYVTRGPARGYQVQWPYDEVDIASFLKTDNNYLCVEVYNGGVSTFGYVSENSAGLLCAGDFENIKIRSDLSWLSRFDRAHKKDTAPYSLQLNFQEHVDARKDDRSWITSNKAPAGWNHPQTTVFGAMPWDDVEERGIPQLNEIQRFPEKLVSMSSGKVSRGYKYWRNIASGLFEEFKNIEWKPENKEWNANFSHSIELQKIEKGTFQAVVLDMGETVVGPACVIIDGGISGTVIDFFFHEVLSDGCSPVIQLPSRDNCYVSMANRIIIGNGRTDYDFYHLIGFRYVTIIVQENSTDVSIQFSMTDTGYPYKIKGKFECSDKILNDIWKICCRTEQVCSIDSYVDTPWREQAQWWGDARIQFWNTMAMEVDVRLFVRGIRSIARQRVPNGLTYGHAPTMAHTCILPDFSLVWIMTIYDYYWQTGDLTLFKEQLPRIREVLSYFQGEAPRYQDLLSYDPRYWLFLDWADLEREGSPTLYNMWYLMVLRTVKQLLDLCGYDEEACKIGLESKQLQTAIEILLFDKDTGLFCDGIGCHGSQSRKHSVQSQTFAILLDLKSEFHNNMLESRILSFLNGEILNVPVPSTYWSSYVLTLAHQKGYYKEAINYIKRMWSRMISFSTCTEVFDIDGTEFSASHAWSAHPIFHLMNILGGVTQDSAGWKRVLFNPYFAPELDYVHITIPSPHGLIESKWERETGNINVSLVLPDGITAMVGIPGYERKVNSIFKCRL